VAQEVRKCDAKIKEITGGKVKTVQKKLEDAKKQLDKIKKEITRLEVEIKDGERQLKKSLDQVRCLSPL
jgi:peptidoglycan hydrolase CwlO-like protein